MSLFCFQSSSLLSLSMMLTAGFLYMSLSGWEISLLGLLRVLIMNARDSFFLCLSRWSGGFFTLCCSFSTEFNFPELLEGRYADFITLWLELSPVVFLKCPKLWWLYFWDLQPLFPSPTFSGPVFPLSQLLLYCSIYINSKFPHCGSLSSNDALAG